MELEIYNSLSDEKKIYLNTEDLLIELKYDVANAEKPVAVDISLTENDEVSVEGLDVAVWGVKRLVVL